jgi:hypothetical protein
MAVTVKNGVFWEFLRSMLQLLVTANIVPNSQFFLTLMMETIPSSKISVLTTATWHHIPEDDILNL